VWACLGLAQGPEALKSLAAGSGMLGSWKVLLEGDFSGIPFTSFWRHRRVPPGAPGRRRRLEALVGVAGAQWLFEEAWVFAGCSRAARGCYALLLCCHV
jgi:hypothetical protein